MTGDNNQVGTTDRRSMTMMPDINTPGFKRASYDCSWPIVPGRERALPWPNRARWSLERVMGIEPTRVAPIRFSDQSLTDAADLACDSRVNLGRDGRGGHGTTCLASQCPRR